MSEKEKSGEDLIEQTEDTVVQEEQESKEEIPSFDAKAFAGNEADATKETKEEVQEESKEETTEEEGSDDDDFEWGSVEQKKQDEPEEEDWDPTPKEEKKEAIEEAVYD